MPCSTDDRSKRRYDTRINAIVNTLESVTSNGNYTTKGVDITGNIKTGGYFIGDASFMSNISYINELQNLTLEEVTANGNVTTIGAKFGGDLGVGGFFIGSGSGIFNLPWQLNPSLTVNLQDVTSQEATTNHKINFTNDVTSLEAYGNVIVSGNVTCSKLIGNGEFLDGVANVYELSLLDSSVSSFENKTIITNTSGLTDVSKGDILTSTANGVLGKLSIGSNGQILIADTIPKWDNITNIFNIEGRTTSLENETIFDSTKNLTSVTTGDILYGYGTDDLRRLARETTADNTHLTTDDYGTGYGRLLRIDERSENVMWLHPTHDLDYSGLLFGVDPDGFTYIIGNSAAIISTGTTPIDYLHFELSISPEYVGMLDQISNSYLRIHVGSISNYFTIKFNDFMFYSEQGIRFADTYNPYLPLPPAHEAKQPAYINYHWYLAGTMTAALYGDGSKLILNNGPTIPSTTISQPSVNAFMGKGGYLTVYSDIRRKSKIQAMSKSLDTLSKLLPKTYIKDGKRESGFIAQEMYYDAREMRHIVWPDRDANPNDHAPEADYSDWGKRHACLRYLHFIAYVVRSIQELRERIERLKK